MKDFFLPNSNIIIGMNHIYSSTARIILLGNVLQEKKSMTSLDIVVSGEAEGTMGHPLLPRKYSPVDSIGLISSRT